MGASNETILRRNAMDGENAIYGFAMVIGLIASIIISIYRYLTGEIVYYGALVGFIPLGILGADIFLFQLRGQEIFSVVDNNTLRITHKGGIFTKKWNFKFEEICDIKPYKTDPVSQIVEMIAEFRRGTQNKYKMLIFTRGKHFSHTHICGYNMSDEAIAELKSDLKELGWSEKP